MERTTVNVSRPADIAPAIDKPTRRSDASRLTPLDTPREALEQPHEEN